MRGVSPELSLTVLLAFACTATETSPAPRIDDPQIETPAPPSAAERGSGPKAPPRYP
jgi:hypothetical protein